MLLNRNSNKNYKKKQQFKYTRNMLQQQDKNAELWKAIHRHETIKSFKSFK